MLYTLLQHGVETTVDRRHKTHRIINWIKQVDKIKKNMLMIYFSTFIQILFANYRRGVQRKGGRETQCNVSSNKPILMMQGAEREDDGQAGSMTCSCQAGHSCHSCSSPPPPPADTPGIPEETFSDVVSLIA